MKIAITKRFVKEYANYRIKSAEENVFLSDTIVESIRDNVNKAMKFYNRGLITHDEAIRMIWEA